MQEVPISMAAMSGQGIKDFGVNGDEEFSATMPAASIKQNPIGNFIFIRGAGTPGSNQGIEQSMSMFHDGIYMGRSQLFFPGLPGVTPGTFCPKAHLNTAQIRHTLKRKILLYINKHLLLRQRATNLGFLPIQDATVREQSWSPPDFRDQPKRRFL
jgi:hypothetical protein